ncbi:WG repeat-containing protein [Flavilitoribacter nigricans]|uniref:WG repeat-containing protein n=1 Tax=Flavilitoribacter nigricans (strain ATCC 23147 / DSM 23189 / NBRC 102662 / NCIMB 1420 / SS-2) TaxID=1122177 RepID=A0A2D0NIB2_FLAN2|nr:WG repeat-containing protein [Flavilitoribacter nigricans]PHN08130.1 hypothetical protein CRP01_02070 [Flavilitoribacter nigricans DSM 23189 = NBRC 102662]
MVRVLVVCLLVTLGTSLLAQRSFLPVKVGHKWTFVDFSHTVRLDTSRQFDYLGDVQLPWLDNGRPSGFYLVESDEKLGLVDQSFQLVIPPAWDEIYPVSTELFLVFDSLYAVVDARGTDLLAGSRYDVIRTVPEVGDSLFLVKQRDKWGAQKKGEPIPALPTIYSELEYLPVSDGLFKVKPNAKDSAWIVVDWTQRALPALERPQKVILPAGSNYLITREDIGTNWIIRDLAGAPQMTLRSGARIKSLHNNTLFAYREEANGPFTVLVLGEQIETLDMKFDTVMAVDRDMALYRTGRQSGLIFPNGDQIVLEQLNSLEFIDTNQDLFRIISSAPGRQATGKWGLFSKSARSILLPCQYDSIGVFQGNLARCYLDGKVGLLNSSPAEVIPPRFESIPDIGAGIQKVQCYWSDSTMVYYLSESGALDGEPYVDRAVFVSGRGMYYGLNFNYQDDTTQRFIPPANRIDNRPYLTDVNNNEEPDTIWENQDKYLIVSVDNYQVVERITETRTRRRYVPTEREKRRAERRKSNGKSSRLKSNFFTRLFPFLQPKRKGTHQKEVKTSEHWKITFEAQGQTRRCTDVNWELVYHTARGENLIANDFTTFGSSRNRGQRISIFLRDQQRFLPDLSILGIRLQDFRQGLPYAAFIDLEGRMGLIDKAGNQVLDTGGQPLRFAYIGVPGEGKIPAATADSPIGLVYSRTLHNQTRESFHVSIQNNNFSTRRGQTTSQPPKWGFIDSEGNELIPFAYDRVGPFVDSFSIVMKAGKQGVINAENETIVPFLYDYIQDKKEYWRVSNYVDRGQSLFYDFRGRQLPDKKSAQLSTRGETLFPRRSTTDPPLYGYANSLGKMVIPARYETAGYFSDGVAAVRLDKKWFFIDQRDSIRFAVDPSLRGIQRVLEFHEGLCAVQRITDPGSSKRGNRKTGYLDPNGSLVIDTKYHLAGNFQNGHAIVAILDFDHYDERLMSSVPGSYGIINRSGNQIIPVDYEGIIPLNEAGLSVVKSRDSIFNQGVVDLSGQLISNGFHKSAKVFPDGFATFDGFEWRIFDRQSQPIDFPFELISDINYFSEGHLLVQDGEESWHHLFFDGKEVKILQGDFDTARPFTGDYTLVSRSGLSFLYRKDEFLFKAPNAGRFTGWSGDLATVDNHYYVNLELQNLFQRDFNSAGAFKNGVAKVSLKGRSGVINRRGMFVVPPKFTNITIGDDYIEVRPLPRKIGLISRAGKVLIPVEYDQLDPLNEDIIRVEKGDRIGYYRKDGQVIWKPEVVWR